MQNFEMYYVKMTMSFAGKGSGLYLSIQTFYVVAWYLWTLVCRPPKFKHFPMDFANFP